MDVLDQIQVAEGSNYGPLQSRFTFELRRGYTALVGANNSGKSAILQLIFRFLFGQQGFGSGVICFIGSDRGVVEATAQPGIATLQQWNSALNDILGGRPLMYGTREGPNVAELPRLLLSRDFVAQTRELETLLPQVGLPFPRLVEQQNWSFDALSVAVQGSGLRSTFPILMATTDLGLSAILIDEPELSLEPRLQKVLRDVLVNVTERVPVVVVAAHSHLFLNRQDVESTQVVERSGGATTVRTVTGAAEHQL
jgi:ABC-type branched-subunit amino acid transport system ATPase component